MLLKENGLFNPFDFYVVDNKPVIGELTMATGYGYFTDEYYNHLGDLTDVSLIKKIR